MTPLAPRSDGYFRSTLKRHEDWHAGVRMVSEGYEYLRLFPTGRWLSKTHPSPGFDFAAYLGSIDASSLEANPSPLDAEYNQLHTAGRYSLVGNRLAFVWRHFDLILHEHRWELCIESPERLRADDGTVYRFVPLNGT